jgi:hypothetical protein
MSGWMRYALKEIVISPCIIKNKKQKQYFIGGCKMKSFIIVLECSLSPTSGDGLTPHLQNQP